MKIMTVAALHQPLVNSMAEWFGEFCPDCAMTAVAELGLVLDQQTSRLLGVVRRMAIQAANLIAGMGGGFEMRLLLFLGMTTQTPRAGLTPAQLAEADNLGRVASAFDVEGAWPVT